MGKEKGTSKTSLGKQAQCMSVFNYSSVGNVNFVSFLSGLPFPEKWLDAIVQNQPKAKIWSSKGLIDRLICAIELSGFGSRLYTASLSSNPLTVFRGFLNLCCVFNCSFHEFMHIRMVWGMKHCIITTQITLLCLCLFFWKFDLFCARFYKTWENTPKTKIYLITLLFLCLYFLKNYLIFCAFKKKKQLSWILCLF